MQEPQSTRRLLKKAATGPAHGGSPHKRKIKLMNDGDRGDSINRSGEDMSDYEFALRIQFGDELNDEDNEVEGTQLHFETARQFLGELIASRAVVLGSSMQHATGSPSCLFDTGSGNVAYV